MCPLTPRPSCRLPDDAQRSSVAGSSFSLDFHRLAFSAELQHFQMKTTDTQKGEDKKLHFTWEKNGKLAERSQVQRVLQTAQGHRSTPL